MNWHNLDISEVAHTLNSSAEGLKSDDVRSRLSKYGKNEIIDGKNKYKVWKILLNQISNFMIIMLVIAAIISGFAADLTDTIIILSIIIINAIVGFIQEYRAEKALDALKSISRSQAEVFRNKLILKINSSEFGSW